MPSRPSSHLLSAGGAYAGVLPARVRVQVRVRARAPPLLRQGRELHQHLPPVRPLLRQGRELRQRPPPVRRRPPSCTRTRMAMTSRESLIDHSLTLLPLAGQLSFLRTSQAFRTVE